jgi:hypothetical protein
MIKTLNLPKTTVMDIQADISWIRSELIKVQDPELITAFKSLLKYRQKRTNERSAFDLSMDRALLDKEEGRTESHEEIKKKYEKWL